MILSRQRISMNFWKHKICISYISNKITIIHGQYKVNNTVLFNNIYQVVQTIFFNQVLLQIMIFKLQKRIENIMNDY